MAKLKNIIVQLSEPNYKKLYNELVDSKADKTAYLLKTFKENSATERQIIEKINVSKNAYYTLRSRLNQKIEEYLIENCINNKDDIAENDSYITDILFSQKNTITKIALKKLEQEYIEADQPLELMKVYKCLKKFHIGKVAYGEYDKLYEEQYKLAFNIDQVECLVSEYFHHYGLYYIAGGEDNKKILNDINIKINKISQGFSSHHLYVYSTLSNIFHRLFVMNKDHNLDFKLESIDDIIDAVQGILDKNIKDPVYQKLQLICKFLYFEFHNNHHLYKKAEDVFDDINDKQLEFLSFYSAFTFPSQFLISKLKRHTRSLSDIDLEEENNTVFADYEIDYDDITKAYIYTVYRALCCYYSGHYEKSTSLINEFLNNVSLKNYPYAHVEIKTLLALQYCILDDYELFNQLFTSLQRQIRLMKKKNLEHILVFIQILKISINDMKKNKHSKIEDLCHQMNHLNSSYFSPIRLIKMDINFIKLMSKY